MVQSSSKRKLQRRISLDPFKAEAGQEKNQMPADRVSAVLAAYFKQPYEEYGELALEIRGSGGLTREEIGLIKKKVLQVDASTIIRHSGCEEQATHP